MSRHAARNALDQLIGRPALIAPVSVPDTLHGLANPGVEASSVAMLHDLRELATADPVAEAALWQERKATLVSAYYPGQSPAQSKPFAFANGTAIIPIHGTLINRFASSYGFVTGYNFVKTQVAAAEADPEVVRVIYDVNSYGGMVSGCQEASDCIGEAAKPSIAVVDANCYSAAYMLASQAGGIVATPSGGIGSIGVVMMHVDVSKALKDFGVDVSFIYAGEHKVDGNMYQPLSDEVRAEFQADIDACYDMFVAQVAYGRDMNEQDVRDTEARSYRAEDALDLGLIDAIQNPVDAIEAFTHPSQENTMPPANRTQSAPVDPAIAAAAAEQARATQEATSAQAAQAAAVEAAATARTAERARIALIQGHVEAVGRETLAAHLALQTDMTVEAATGILAASPKQAAPPAESHFQRAMEKGGGPNVGAGESEDDDGKTPAQKILASQARMTGYKPPTAH